MFSFAAPDTNSGPKLIAKTRSPAQKITGGNVLFIILALSLVLGILPLLGVVWTLTSGMITTVDRLLGNVRFGHAREEEGRRSRAKTSRSESELRLHGHSNRRIIPAACAGLVGNSAA